MEQRERKALVASLARNVDAWDDMATTDHKMFEQMNFAEVCRLVADFVEPVQLSDLKQVARELVLHVLGERNGAVQA